MNFKGISRFLLRTICLCIRMRGFELRKLIQSPINSLDTRELVHINPKSPGVIDLWDQTDISNRQLISKAKLARAALKFSFQS